jgi:TetR/AcrR family transcriptional repressor of nem operon
VGRPREYDRDQVLQRAMHLFWRKGYEGTHLAELVEVTGLNRFSLYKEFGGKEGLFGEAMDRYMLQLQPLAALLRREPLGLQNIRDYFAALADAKFIHGCFLVNTLPERHVAPKAVFAKICEFAQHAEALLRANLEAAQRAAQLSAQTDVEALAKALFAFDLGLMSYGILPVSREEKRRLVAAAAQRLLGA